MKITLSNLDKALLNLNLNSSITVLWGLVGSYKVKRLNLDWVEKIALISSSSSLTGCYRLQVPSRYPLQVSLENLQIYEEKSGITCSGGCYLLHWPSLNLLHFDIGKKHSWESCSGSARCFLAHVPFYRPMHLEGKNSQVSFLGRWGLKQVPSITPLHLSTENLHISALPWSDSVLYCIGLCYFGSFFKNGSGWCILPQLPVNRPLHYEGKKSQYSFSLCAVGVWFGWLNLHVVFLYEQFVPNLQSLAC